VIITSLQLIILYLLVARHTPMDTHIKRVRGFPGSAEGVQEPKHVTNHLHKKMQYKIPLKAS